MSLSYKTSTTSAIFMQYNAQATLQLMETRCTLGIGRVRVYPPMLKTACSLSLQGPLEWCGTLIFMEGTKSTPAQIHAETLLVAICVY